MNDFDRLLGPKGDEDEPAIVRTDSRMSRGGRKGRGRSKFY